MMSYHKWYVSNKKQSTCLGVTHCNGVLVSKDSRDTVHKIGSDTKCAHKYVYVLTLAMPSVSTTSSVPHCAKNTLAMSYTVRDGRAVHFPSRRTDGRNNNISQSSISGNLESITTMTNVLHYVQLTAQVLAAPNSQKRYVSSLFPHLVQRSICCTFQCEGRLEQFSCLFS